MKAVLKNLSKNVDMFLGKKIKANKGLLFFCGSVALIIGMTMILVWWRDVVMLFRGGMGIFLALSGMLLLYLVKE